jgi:nucleotide-binding universal stress UspA family protein
MFSPKVILHPTDFSECSNYALPLAADLATQYRARLIVLHVVETLGPANVTFGEVEKQLEPQGYLDRLQKELHNVRPPVDSSVSVDYLLVEGDPARGIEQVVLDQHCDLIVMGTHGHRGLERLLLGSVAEQVIRRAPCAVLTARCPTRAGS